MMLNRFREFTKVLLKIKSENTKGRQHVRVLGVYVKTVLKRMCKWGRDSSSRGQGRMIGACQNDKLPDSIKEVVFLPQLNDY